MELVRNLASKAVAKEIGTPDPTLDAFHHGDLTYGHLNPEPREHMILMFDEIRDCLQKLSREAADQNQALDGTVTVLERDRSAEWNDSVEDGIDLAGAIVNRDLIANCPKSTLHAYQDVLVSIQSTLNGASFTPNDASSTSNVALLPSSIVPASRRRGWGLTTEERRIAEQARTVQAAARNAELRRVEAEGRASTCFHDTLRSTHGSALPFRAGSVAERLEMLLLQRANDLLQEQKDLALVESILE